MTMQEHEDIETSVARVIAFTLQFGTFDNGRYKMSVTGGMTNIEVRDLDTNLLVAYSSTKADFEYSLVEFATDYFA